MTTQVVILAAGMGSRLGRTLPKPLTELSDGRTIMGQQFDNIHHAFGNNAKVTIVVGYKLEHIIEAFPQASFVYKEQYDQTNTSKSLMRALQASGPGGVLWMNGDVVFDPAVLNRAAAMIARDQSFVTVNTSKVSDEEVKYTTSAEGYIKEQSTTVKGGLGEAVGINYISAADKNTLAYAQALAEACRQQAAHGDAAALQKLIPTWDPEKLRPFGYLGLALGLQEHNQ